MNGQQAGESREDQVERFRKGSGTWEASCREGVSWGHRGSKSILGVPWRVTGQWIREKLRRWPQGHVLLPL
jgi:hypothetical protein